MAGQDSTLKMYPKATGDYQSFPSTINVGITGLGITASQGAITVQTTSGGLPFPLNTGHFMPAKAALTAVYPRPDAETPSWARHRLAYYDGGANNVEYRIPIGVRFGSWPYKYTLISGPNGMSIGSYITDANYGILTWTPTGTESGKTITVRVQDQELNSVDITWSISTTSATTSILFVDAVNGNDSTGTGTISAPFKTVSKVMGSTYQKRIVYFRQGTYASAGGTIGQSVSPMALLNFPGEIPTFNMSSNYFSSNNASDAFLQGITFSGGQTGATNYRTIWMDGVDNRQTFNALSFTNVVNGTAADDNPTGIFFASNTSQRANIYISDCVEIGRPAATGINACGLFVFFTTKDSLVERNTVANSRAGQGNMMLKSSCTGITFRQNSIQAVAGAQGFISGSIDQVDYSQRPGNNEWCYNTMNAPLNVKFNYHNDTTSPGTYWIYRNSVNGGMATRNSNSQNGPFIFENNAVVIDAGAPISNENGTGASLTNTGTECQGLQSTGILNLTTTLLQGSYRTTWLGRRGAEVA